MKKVNKTVKKKHPGINNVIKKLKYNSKLQSPKVIVQMYNRILSHPNDYTPMQSNIAKRMVERAQKQIKKQKHKKLKPISKKEKKIYKQYQNSLRITQREECKF